MEVDHQKIPTITFKVLRKVESAHDRPTRYLGLGPDRYAERGGAEKASSDVKNLEDRTGSALGTPLAFPEPSQRDRPTGSQPHELSPIFPLCPPCPPCEPVFSGNAGLESGRFFFSGRILSLAGFSSVPSVPSVRTRF